MSTPATAHPCPRCAAGTTAGPASRSARRWMAGSMLLAALAAVALFWLLVKPRALPAGPPGLNGVATSSRISAAGRPTRAQIAQRADAGDRRGAVDSAPSNAVGRGVDEAAREHTRGAS